MLWESRRTVTVAIDASIRGSVAGRASQQPTAAFARAQWLSSSPPRCACCVVPSAALDAVGGTSNVLLSRG